MKESYEEVAPLVLLDHELLLRHSGLRGWSFLKVAEIQLAQRGIRFE